MPDQPISLPDINDVLDAARRLEGRAVRTPLLRCDAVDQATGTTVYFKPENLQRTGSFKFRGAYNAIVRLPEEARRRGVLTCSSGNHAQGVAEAARLVGVPATIVMPADAPAIKVERTRRTGGEIIFYDRATGDRMEIAREIEADRGMAFVHPYDNADVIAGQGTCGLEIASDLAAWSVQPDRLLVCTGGGGLTAGLALAVKDRFPGLKIHTVEPAGFDDTKRSLESGKIVANARSAGSACDALLSATPGELSFAINRNLIESGLVVTDAQAFAAMRLAFDELKLVVEPGGAVALAALVQFAHQWRGETIVCVISGGNVDPELFGRILDQPQSSREGGETTEVE